MAGTPEGGKLAAQRNMERHGKDFYRRIGARGGKNGTTGGFAANRELAREMGKIGGARSSRKGIPSTTYKGKKKVQK